MNGQLGTLMKRSPKMPVIAGEKNDNTKLLFLSVQVWQLKALEFDFVTTSFNTKKIFFLSVLIFCKKGTEAF